MNTLEGAAQTKDDKVPSEVTPEDPQTVTSTGALDEALATSLPAADDALQTSSPAATH